MNLHQKPVHTQHLLLCLWLFPLMYYSLNVNGTTETNDIHLVAEAIAVAHENADVQC